MNYRLIEKKNDQSSIDLLTDEQIDWLYITINVLLISFNDFDSILFILYRFTNLYTNQNFVLLIFVSLSEGELEHNRFFFTNFY